MSGYEARRQCRMRARFARRSATASKTTTQGQFQLPKTVAADRACGSCSRLLSYRVFHRQPTVSYSWSVRCVISSASPRALRRSSFPVPRYGRLSMRTNWSFLGRHSAGKSLFPNLSRHSSSLVSSSVCSTTRRSPFFSSGTAVTTNVCSVAPASSCNLAANLAEAA